MKRTVLPVEVLFENRVVNAFVSLKEQGYDLLFRIWFREPEIQLLLPDGYFQFSFAQGIGAEESLSDRAERLIEKTIEALSYHIDKLETTFTNAEASNL